MGGICVGRRDWGIYAVMGNMGGNRFLLGGGIGVGCELGSGIGGKDLNGWGGGAPVRGAPVRREEAVRVPCDF